MTQRYRWVILGLTFSAIVVAYANVFICSTLAVVLMEKLGLTYTEVGTFMTGYLLVYSLFGLLAGYLSDLYGTKRVLILGVLLASASGFLFGLVSNYMQGLLCRFSLGIGLALIWSSSLKLISQWFSSGQNATATSIFIGGIAIGEITAMSTPPIITLAFNWRYAFFILAIPGFIIALLQLFLLKENPFVLDSFEKETAAKGKPEGKRQEFVWRNRYMWLTTLLFFCSLFHVYGVRSWVPSYLVNVGFPLVAAGQLSAIMVFGGLFTPMLGGIVADKLGRKLPVIAVGFMLALLTATLSITVMDLMLLPIILFIIGASTAVTSAISISLLLSTVPKDVTGRAIGVFSTIGYMGGVFSTLVGGYLLDLTGSYIPLLLAYTFSALLGAIITFLNKEHGINRLLR